MTVIHVAGTPLQPAIDAAQSGDTIAPSAGTYAGRLKIPKGKVLTFEGNGSVILDGGQGDGFVNVDVDSTKITMRGFDYRHAGCAVRFKGDCTGSLIEQFSIPIVDWMVRNTQGGSDDNGGNGFQFTRGTRGVTVQDGSVRLGRAVSYDYKRDGGAFEVFVAQDITIRRCETWDNVVVAEFGKGANDPPSRNILIEDCTFHGRPNYDSPASDTTVANGIYVRAVEGLVIRNNLFDRIDWWDIVLATQGPYAGPLANVVIEGNRARLLPGVNRWIHADAGVDKAQVHSDRNSLWPGTGTVLVEIPPQRWKTKATVVSATGWEANSYVGPEPSTQPPVPVPDPCGPVNADLLTRTRERDAALADALQQRTRADAAEALATARKNTLNQITMLGQGAP